MATYDLTPQRIYALANLLRYNRAEGSMSVTTEIEYRAGDMYRDDGPVSKRTKIILELEVEGGDELRFLQMADAEEAYQRFAAPRAPQPPDPQQAVTKLVTILRVIDRVRERAEKTELCWRIFVDIVRVIERAWAMDDTSKRFRLLELD
jgi:hypothetical protein